METRRDERGEHFLLALKTSTATLADLYPYEVEIDDGVEVEVDIVEEAPVADFQATEEPTAVAAPSWRSTPPPLPPSEQLRAYKVAVRKTLEAHGFGSMADQLLAQAEAYPFRCDSVGAPR